MKHSRFWAAAVVGLALVAASCGSDDKADAPVATTVNSQVAASTTGPPTTTSAVSVPSDASGGTSVGGGGDDDQPTGDLVVDGLQRFPALQAEAKKGVKASGDPIRVGFITTVSGNYVYKMFADAADASVAFLNSIGGVNGRPIELVQCGTNGSPESAQTCATEMVNSDVVAVGMGNDFNTAAIAKALESVNLSTFGGNALFDPERVAPNTNFYYSNWAFQAKTADYINDVIGAKSVAILSSNSPVGLSVATNRAQKPLTALGIKSEIFGESVTAGSFDAVASNAVGFDAVVNNGGNLQCSGFLLSLANVGFTGPAFVPDGCGDQATLDAGVGQYFANEYYSPFGDPSEIPAHAAAEVALYIAQSHERNGSLALGGFEQMGFAQMVNFAETLAGSGLADFDASSVSDLLSSSKGANFTAGDFDCGATPYKPFPALCSFEAVIYKWDGTTMKLAGGVLAPPSQAASQG